MINKIVNEFEKCANQHLLVNSFRYGDTSNETSVNSDIYPQLILEDPIIGSLPKTQSPSMTWNINFDILTNSFDKSLVSETQDMCFYVAQQIILRLVDENNFSFGNLSFMTIENYSDNDLFGVRVSCDIYTNNTFQFCLNEQHFDNNKVNVIPTLGDIDLKTDEQGNCGVWKDNYNW